METSPQQVTYSFGFSWSLAVAQVLGIIWLAAAIYATRLAARSFSGWLLLSWILVAWLLPVFGAFIVIYVCRHRRAT